MKRSTKVLEVFRGLMAAYVLTGIVLAVLAFLVYKFELKEAVVNISIIATYILASLTGGFVVGKRVKERKFFWGILLGLLYILVIFLASMVMNQKIDVVSINNITALFMCVGGGMLGGMLS